MSYAFHFSSMHSKRSVALTLPSHLWVLLMLQRSPRFLKEECLWLANRKHWFSFSSSRFYFSPCCKAGLSFPHKQDSRKLDAQSQHERTHVTNVCLQGDTTFVKLIRNIFLPIPLLCWVPALASIQRQCIRKKNTTLRDNNKTSGGL